MDKRRIIVHLFSIPELATFEMTWTQETERDHPAPAIRTEVQKRMKLLSPPISVETNTMRLCYNEGPGYKTFDDEINWSACSFGDGHLEIMVIFRMGTFPPPASG
eukprot:gnl/Spiro4/17921_TR9550_c0_g1_i1.p2 gnl/Spiro4/17921_TR9550_c0_g1~~gnl/Spiro4/17921_TR9550_c0_g1_i1.p2  ORF type:complete len:115 (+),score=35.99 gnl/Spiro4/17921_TR9550_c0_g1_i1:33-347(+)